MAFLDAGVVFLAVLVWGGFIIAIGSAIRVRRTRRPVDQRHAKYFEHGDRPAVCICPDCRAVRAEQLERRAVR